jgi:hypothetical protein
LASFIAVITIAFGGIYYLISYGQGKFTSEAKEWIKAGILGLLIILCSVLIIKTINPNLSKCNFAFLPDVDLGDIFGPPSLTPPGADVRTVTELPIGVLAEKLLTRTTYCYGFDRYGNPIFHGISVASTGPGGTDKIEAEKDRLECFKALVSGAQKKAAVPN